ncbi:hypothetical protein SKAU_G00226760 [Synaphobranchus kaupii]|uniref:Uncharacterized protein n=1 Tax=Synaphobranchus kaupii TaxID=118154 RepID=A0A9Q1F4Y6_SYNKA|nr:hypothetical protein SKAU_G00226760 [Synaphobranchus kaupii]
MNVKILTLVIVLLLSLLCSASAGPMASREQGREGQPEPPASRLEKETPPAPPLSQGANAILEKALLRLPSPGS